MVRRVNNLNVAGKTGAAAGQRRFFKVNATCGNASATKTLAAAPAAISGIVVETVEGVEPQVAAAMTMVIVVVMMLIAVAALARKGGCLLPRFTCCWLSLLQCCSPNCCCCC